MTLDNARARVSLLRSRMNSRGDSTDIVEVQEQEAEVRDFMREVLAEINSGKYTLKYCQELSRVALTVFA